MQECNKLLYELRCVQYWPPRLFSDSCVEYVNDYAHTVQYIDNVMLRVVTVITSYSTTAKLTLSLLAKRAVAARPLP